MYLRQTNTILLMVRVRIIWHPVRIYLVVRQFLFDKTWKFISKCGGSFI